MSALRHLVGEHPAVHHSFLRRFAVGGLARWQLWGYASQHYHLVRLFTAYPEAVAARTPDREVRRLVMDILEEEYIRPDFAARSHQGLYRRFMRAIGMEEGDWNAVALLPTTQRFVEAHFEMAIRSWLETLGAVAAGHEWAIPLMFPPLVRGIEQSVPVGPGALEYFQLHIDLDVQHGEALERCLMRWAEAPEHQRQLWRGACRSLDARAAFWRGLEEQLLEPES